MDVIQWFYEKFWEFSHSAWDGITSFGRDGYRSLKTGGRYCYGGVKNVVKGLKDRTLSIGSDTERMIGKVNKGVELGAKRAGNAIAKTGKNLNRNMITKTKNHTAKWN